VGHAHEHAQPRTDGPDHLVGDADLRAEDTLDDGPHRRPTVVVTDRAFATEH